MTVGGKCALAYSGSKVMLTLLRSIAYMINENSIQFNIVSKNLGCERMAFYLSLIHI